MVLRKKPFKITTKRADRNALVRNKSLCCRIEKVVNLALAIRVNALIVKSKLADIGASTSIFKMTNQR